jgi:PAS domain S-box-containing protein
MIEEKIHTTLSGSGDSGEMSSGDIASFWLAAVIDSAEDAIISKSLDGIITSWNKSAERIFGYRADEAIGKHVLMLIPPDHHNEEPEIISKIMKGERVEHYQTIRVRKDGSLVDISLTISPIKDASGKIIGASKIARDISDLKRTEQALRDSEKQTRLITDSIPALVAYVDLDRRYQFVNRAYEEWFGLKAEEIVGRKVRDLVGDESYQSTQNEMQKVLSGEEVAFERFMPYAKGGEKYVHVNYVPDIDNQTGEVKGFFTLVQDVSESKRAEIKLLESESRFSKAFNSSPLSLTISSLETGKLIEVNDTFVKITGYTREESIGKTTIELGLWARPTERDEEMNTVREAGTIRNQEYVFSTRNGAIVGLLSAEHIEIGGESFALTVIQDITERKQATDRLRESEKNLQMAMDAARIYSWEFIPSKRKINWSDNLESVIGFALPPDNENAVEDLVHPEDKELLSRDVLEALANKTNYESEFRIINPHNGDILWMRSQGVPVTDETNKNLRIVGVTQNITRRKQAEQEREELLRSEHSARLEAEEANRLKDEFLATVSHELRTPLNAILGWSQMLMSKRFDQIDHDAALETIYRNAKAQAQLIEDILDVSRIITGKIRLDAQPISLAAVIQTAAESLRPAIEAKSLKIQMHLDFEPQMVYADPNRMRQVIWNLLSNAIKFTPERGEVTIELKSTEAQTRIVVTDTGKGISAGFLPHVFERFRQGDGSSTRTHGGLGLGLAIVRHIVELHGGTVDVESGGENKGSSFSVCLPAGKSAENDSSASDGSESIQTNGENSQEIVPDSAIKGLRVLLLDDEPDTLELLSLVLRQCGAEVETNTHVREALETISRWKPDVVVSDIGIPEEDGYSFIKKLRALSPEQGGTIPVIALTAYVGIKERTQVLASGFQMYVPKPVEPSELIGALANFV